MSFCMNDKCWRLNKNQQKFWSDVNNNPTQLTMYYIRLLLYDSVIVTLQFSHGFSMKCIGYYTNCIGAVMQSNLTGINTHRIVTNTLRKETVTKS